MYRVILIDNEPWVLKGLTLLIPWEAHGFDVIGTYVDPVRAYDAILADPPELVVVDIRMPELDGLTLLHKAREHGVTSAFVIVSGYAEFEYARDAMNDHALEYLLKPVDPGDMEKVLVRVSADLEKERHKAADLHEKKDFRPLITAASDDDAWYAVAQTRYAAMDELDAHLGQESGFTYALYLRGERDVAVVCAGGNDLGKRVTTALHEFLSKRPGVRGGVSSVTKNPLLFGTALGEAEAAAHQDFVDSKARLTVYQTPRNDSLTALARKITLYFSLRQRDNLISAIREIPAAATDAGVGIDGVVGFWNRLAALINVERAGDAAQREMYTATVERLALEFQYIQAMCDFLERTLGDMVSEMTVVPRESGVGERFFELLDEISAHYEKKLSLNELANRHCLNISYCCKLFKRVTRGTFSDYLIRLRLERAQHAMRTAGIDASQVYALVGYGDYYYFRRSYQKHFGKPPGSETESETRFGESEFS